MKEAALEYGYNLLIHGSMARDLDLVAIPWIEHSGDVDLMINEFAEILGGSVMLQEGRGRYSKHPHGRRIYVIDIERGGYRDGVDSNGMPNYKPDPQYYIDISVMPTNHII
jgi:hypothetical protein